MLQALPRLVSLLLHFHLQRPSTRTVMRMSELLPQLPHFLSLERLELLELVVSVPWDNPRYVQVLHDSKTTFRVETLLAVCCRKEHRFHIAMLLMKMRSSKLNTV